MILGADIARNYPAMRSATLSFIFFSISLIGQVDWASYGLVRPSALQQDSSWASDNGVEILFDLAEVKFDKSGFEIELHRHKRIKVYKKDSLKRDQFEIPYVKEDRLKKPRATLYRWKNGKVKKTELRSHQIGSDIQDASTKVLKYDFPDVEDGDILEFSYDLVYNEWRNLDRWWFQDKIPTRRSDLILEVPEYFEFIERSSTDLPYDRFQEGRRKVGDYDLHIYHYGMEFIPAFFAEPFSNARYDYRRNVIFELSSVHIPGVVDRSYYAADFRQLVEELSTSPRFGRELRGNPFLNSLIDSVCSASIGSKACAIKLYDFVRKEFQFDHSAENQSVRAIHASQQGNRWDINRYFIALCNQSGIRSNPVLLNTGASSKYSLDTRVNTQFDDLYSFIKIDGEEYVCDASNKNLPFGYLTPEQRFGSGLLVDSKDARWINLESGPEDQRIYSADFHFDTLNNLIGAFNVLHKDYAAYLFLIEDSQQGSHMVTEDYQKTESYFVNDSDSVEIVEQFEVILNPTINDSLSTISFDPLPFGGIKHNPFTQNFRQQPIVFPSPFERRVSYSFKIPAGYKLISRMEPVDIGLPDDSGYFRFRISQIGEMVVLSSQFKITKKTFYQESYPYLQRIYSILVDKHSENIVLKKD
ncbi:MAG: DUF3857 domain-containing protein [Flavobacteriales bacterium]|nr:DUF3857 domain-containing protein [Flavobacteriales bacterium]